MICFEQEQTEGTEIFPFGFLSVLSVASCSMPLAFQFAKEPGPGMGPVVVGGARGNAENLGRFLEGQADEVTQLDQFSFELALRGEFVERLVHGERLHRDRPARCHRGAGRQHHVHRAV